MSDTSIQKIDRSYNYFFFFLVVFFLFGACVNAEAATDFTALEDLGFFKSLEALLATDFDVFSFLFFAIVLNFKL